MKDELPKYPNKIECGIINLENSYQLGSHWTCYYKNNDKTYYFDSYGDSKPPIELVKYIGSHNLWYNEDRVQDFNDPPICGHLCLLFLKYLPNYDFKSSLNFLIKKKSLLNNGETTIRKLLK